jgi:hypothetical protein
LFAEAHSAIMGWMMSSEVELACDGCGETAVVNAGVINSYGVIARPTGWTHGGHGMAVIGAKDYCPSCSPRSGSTPWNDHPPLRPEEGLLVLLLLD